MKNLFALLLVLVCSHAAVRAFSALPIPPQSVTVQYHTGCKATFTYGIEQETPPSPEEQRKRFFDFDLHAEWSQRERERQQLFPKRKIVKLQFTFADDRKAEVPEVDCRDIELIRLSESTIVTLRAEGSWALSVGIRNLRQIPERKVDDRVVYLFENYHYKERWLKLDGRTITSIAQRFLPIQIPKIDAQDVSLRDLVEFVAHRIRELDPRSPGGISFLYQGFIPENKGAATSHLQRKRVSYTVENVRVDQVFNDLARLFDVEFHITSVGVVITPIGIPPFPNLKSEWGTTYFTYSPRQIKREVETQKSESK
jgi:hypothetical protein